MLASFGSMMILFLIAHFIISPSSIIANCVKKAKKTAPLFFKRVSGFFGGVSSGWGVVNVERLWIMLVKCH